jgi:hypothetical protein
MQKVKMAIIVEMMLMKRKEKSHLLFMPIALPRWNSREPQQCKLFSLAHTLSYLKSMSTLSK